MGLFSSTLFFLGLVLSTESQSSSKYITGCSSKMSCIADIQRFSPVPPKISFAPGPLPCIQLTVGTITRKVAPDCEKFVESAAGSVRQRAIALTNLGYYYQFEPNGDIESIKTWDRAIAVDPSYVEPLIAKAATSAGNFEYPEAIRLLDVAQEKDALHWRIWALRSEIFLKNGNLTDALQTAKNSLLVSPDNPAAHFVLATAMLQTGDLKNSALHFMEAGKDYDAAAPAQFPGVMQYGNPWSSAAYVEIQRKEYASALIAISNGIDGVNGHQGDANLKAKRAEILELLGRYGDAASEYDEVAAMYSSAPNAADEWSEQYKVKAAAMFAKAGMGSKASRAFDDILITGDFKKILKVQLFLRNNGFDDVLMNGKDSTDLRSAISACVARSNCFATMRQSL